MTTPLISICIPAYKARRYLPETLAGVRAQTFTDWELIVTEDGSDEDVESLVRAFAAGGPQTVGYQRHERNLGLPAARNTGITAARGEWIALLDSDDLWAPTHLAGLVAFALQRPAADFVHTGSVLFESETGRQLVTRAPTTAAIRTFPRSLYVGAYAVQPSSVLLRKSLWARVGGFNPASRYAEDREMWLRCARAGAVFAYNGRNTCLYRQHASALSTHTGPMALACAALLSQHLDWAAIDPGLRRRTTAEAWLSAGRIPLRSAPREARDCFVRAWRIQPSVRTAAYWLTASLLALKAVPPPPAVPTMSPAPLNSVVTTLFEGDYHLGAAALVNSLCAAGFAGTVVCGHRGPPPPWAPAARQLGPVTVEFVALDTPAHLTNHKTDFLHHVWTNLHPAAERLYYFDPDIVIKTRWSFFEEWTDYGVALVEDVNSPLPESHPRRGAWRRCLARRHQLVRRETSLYVNGGFIGLAGAHRGFLHEWRTAMALVGDEIGGLERSMFSFGAQQPAMASPAYPFNKTDQDALNIAVMTAAQPVSIMGGEGMDFRPGGWTMAHALGGEKPWRKKYLRAALAGRAPTTADREFWRHVTTPLPVFPARVTAWRRGTLALAGLAGRFYRRA